MSSLDPGLLFVLEDDEATGHGIGRALEQAGWGVRSFTDVTAFLEDVFRDRPQAAVLGHAGPRGEIERLAQRIRRCTVTSRMRLLAHVDVEPGVRSRASLMADGFDDVLHRPAAPQDFQRRLPKGVRSAHLALPVTLAGFGCSCGLLAGINIHAPCPGASQGQAPVRGACGSPAVARALPAPHAIIAGG